VRVSLLSLPKVSVHCTVGCATVLDRSSQRYTDGHKILHLLEKVFSIDEATEITSVDVVQL
jgi:hypothetical protein